MEQELTCPKCKGNKFSLLTKDTFKCAYCGNVFSTNNNAESESTASAEPARPSAQPTPQVIYVQNSPKEENNQDTEMTTGDHIFVIVSMVITVAVSLLLAWWAHH